MTSQHLQLTEGFPLTSENYTAAWQLLDERYGNEQSVNYILSHEQSNYSTECKRNAKTARYHIESNVRALRSLGMKYGHFGPLLVPIILEKLPNTIKLQISRKLGKENCNIEQFLSAIKQEITARENFEYLKINSFDSKKESKNVTTSSLHPQARLKKCVLYVGTKTRNQN